MQFLAFHINFLTHAITDPIRLYVQLNCLSPYWQDVVLHLDHATLQFVYLQFLVPSVNVSLQTQNNDVKMIYTHIYSINKHKVVCSIYAKKHYGMLPTGPLNVDDRKKERASVMGLTRDST